MAKRPLTPKEKANFAARNAASKKLTAAAKAKAAGIKSGSLKVQARSAKEIEAAIAKAKKDPKFMAKFKDVKPPKTTNVKAPRAAVKPRGGMRGGGGIGGFGGGLPDYNR
jgi:hypothetical protein